MNPQNEMSEQQQKHIAAIVRRFSKEATYKYAAGVREHGGNIWETPTLDLIVNAMQEMLDGYVYLYTIKEQIEAQIDMEARLG